MQKVWGFGQLINMEVPCKTRTSVHNGLNCDTPKTNIEVTSLLNKESHLHEKLSKLSAPFDLISWKVSRQQYTRPICQPCVDNKNIAPCTFYNNNIKILLKYFPIFPTAYSNFGQLKYFNDNFCRYTLYSYSFTIRIEFRERKCIQLHQFKSFEINKASWGKLFLVYSCYLSA